MRHKVGCGEIGEETTPVADTGPVDWVPWAISGAAKENRATITMKKYEVFMRSSIFEGAPRPRLLDLVLDVNSNGRRITPPP